MFFILVINRRFNIYKLCLGMGVFYPGRGFFYLLFEPEYDREISCDKKNTPLHAAGIF